MAQEVTGKSFRVSLSRAQAPLTSTSTTQEKAARKERRRNPGRRRPMPTMKRLERGMRAHQIVHRKVARAESLPAGTEGPRLPPLQEEITMALHAPGQRGIVQVLLQGKRDLATTLPLMKRVQEDSRVIKKRREKQRHVRGKVSRQVHNILVYTQTALAEWNLQRGAAIQAAAEADMAIKKTKLPKAKATVPPAPSAPAPPARRGEVAEWTPDPILVLQNLIKGIQNVEKLREKEAELDGDDEELAAQVARANRLADELKRQSERQASMATAFMGTKYNKDAATAVGCGPPGGIAFSPFASHDPVFERADVVQTILENNRRAVQSHS